MAPEIIMAFVMLGIALGIYFIPSLVASDRGHHNTGAIIVLNLFLGWTLLGWVLALVWASTQVRPKERPIAAEIIPPTRGGQ